MTTIFENTKVFAAAAVLFAVATFASTGDVAVRTGFTVMPAIEVESQLGPTMPPSPWDEEDGKATAKLGPTMPPSPWDEDDGK